MFDKLEAPCPYCGSKIAVTKVEAGWPEASLYELLRTRFSAHVAEVHTERVTRLPNRPQSSSVQINGPGQLSQEDAAEVIRKLEQG